MKYSVERIDGNIFRVRCHYNEDFLSEVFRGSISECEAFIRLAEKGYIKEFSSSTFR